MDCVALRGIEIHAYHGLHDFEKTEGNDFVIDAFFWADLSKAGRSDDIQDTVDYSLAYTIISEVMQGASKNLMEALLEEMKIKIMLALPDISKLELRIQKKKPPIGGSCVASEVRRIWLNA